MSASLELNTMYIYHFHLIDFTKEIGLIVFHQDGTGSRTLSLSSDFESPAAGGITLTTTARATDVLAYIILGPNRILLGSPLLAFG